MSTAYRLLGFVMAAHVAIACESSDDREFMSDAQGGAANGAAGARASGGTVSKGAGGNVASARGGSFGAGGASYLSTGGTSTAVPSAPAIPERANVVLHHQSDVTDATTNRITMRLFIENRSVDVLPLAEVSVRYWMTSEVPAPYLHSYFAGPSVRGQTLGFVDAGAASHIEVRFAGGVVTRGEDLNQSAVDIQIEGGTFVQSNDYSFSPGDTKRRPNDRITVYLAGSLIWGCEPRGACPGSIKGASGEGGAGGEDGTGGVVGESGAGGTGGGGAGGEAGFAGGSESPRRR